MRQLYIERAKDSIHCSLPAESVPPATLCAFYLQKYNHQTNSDERIGYQRYSTSRAATFPISREEAGIFKATCFVKDLRSGPQTVASRPLFIHPKATDITTLRKQSDLSSTGKISINGWDIPYAFRSNGSKRLFVFLSSAVNRQEVTLPVFHRWGWVRQSVFPGDCLLLADPTLELDVNLSLGWYFGDRERYLPASIAEVIKCVAAIRGISLKNTTIWGSSAGGFAALSVGPLVEGSTAVPTDRIIQKSLPGTIRIV